jgi:predicted enzyme related to lactoylglutathione lyase
MLKVTEIAFSCYAVMDMPRARKFYEGALGLKPSKVTESPGRQFVEYEIGPHILAIGCAPEAFKAGPDGCCAVLEVGDFDAAVTHLRANEVRFRMEPMASPVCRMAFIFDPDGNTICIHKRNSDH